jgi:hypothetical protein
MTKKTKAHAAAVAAAGGLQRSSYTIREVYGNERFSESSFRNIRDVGFGPKISGHGGFQRVMVKDYDEWRAWFWQPSTQEALAKALRQQREERLRKRQHSAQPQATQV